MTEEEKIFAGKMFDPRRQELRDLKHRAHEACRKYNAMDEYDPARGDVLRAVLGSAGTKDIPAGWLAYGNPCRPIRPITAADSKRELILEEDLEHFAWNLNT